MKTRISIQFVSILGFCLVFTSCKTVTKQNITAQNHFDADYNCVLNGTLTKEQRRAISHFKIAKKIKLISFSQNVVTATPIDHNILASKYLKDEITLTDSQIDQLTEILYNYNYSKELKVWGYSHNGCYEPRHSIVFLNSSDKVFGYFEICFECRNVTTLPAGENIGTFCADKYELLKDFFKSAGVQFFEEEREE